MTEPHLPNVKTLLILIYVSLAAAILILLIDMKIKNDILTAAADFYKRVGTEIPDEDGKSNPISEDTLPLPSRSSVLPLPNLDNVTRMEASLSLRDSEAQAKSTRRARGVRRGKAEDSAGISEGTEEPPDGDEPA